MLQKYTNNEEIFQGKNTKNRALNAAAADLYKLKIKTMI